MKRLALGFLLLPGCALAAEYTFSADADAQLGRVTVKLERPSRAFNMPAWAPGDYEIFDYGRAVKEIKFFRLGEVVGFQTEGPNRWVTHGDVDEVVYAVAPTRGNFTPNLRLRADEYYVSGPGVLGWFDGDANNPQTLTLRMPAGWNVGIALPSVGSKTVGNEEKAEANHTFRAPNYDVLIDSPFVAGAAVRFAEFTVEGVPHRIVGYNQVGTLDLKGFADLGAKIAKAAHTLFGEFGYASYDFMLDFGGPGGGLEHLNSTRIGLSPRTAPLYAAGIMAHEYFHNYNVKRIRAKALGPFDYSKPGVTGTLWWLEGVTDYYAELLLVRAGVQSRTEFVDSMAQTIADTQQGKYLSISADEASRRVWEARGSFGFGGVNYYARGRAAGAVLDLAIRAHTNNERSLDDVMRALWKECKNGPGYKDARLRELCMQVGGPKLGEIYDACVMKPGPFPIQQAVAPWGILFGTKGFTAPEGSGFNKWPYDLRR